jgi:hypothetical protein
MSQVIDADSNWQMAISKIEANLQSEPKFALIGVIRGWFYFVATELLLACVCGSCKFLGRA